MKIDLSVISVMASLVTFSIGIISAISVRHAKDALTKNNLLNRVINLENFRKSQEASIESQKSATYKNREEILKLQEKHENLHARISEFQTIQRDEINDIKLIQTESTKAIIQLEATLKGLSSVIKSKL